MDDNQTWKGCSCNVSRFVPRAGNPYSDSCLETEMRWNLVQVGPKSLCGCRIQRLFTYGLVMTVVES